RILQHIEEIVRSQPEVENTSRRTGLQLGLAAVTEANRGDFTVKLKRDRKRDIDEVISDVRSEIEQTEPAAKVEFVQVLQDMIGDLTSSRSPSSLSFSRRIQNSSPTLLRVLPAPFKKFMESSTFSTALRTPSAVPQQCFKSILLWLLALASRPKRSPWTPPPFWKVSPPPRPWLSTIAPTPSVFDFLSKSARRWIA